MMRKNFLAACAVLLVGAVGLVAAWWLSPQDPFRADLIPADKPFPSLTYSVQVGLWWDDGSAGYLLDSVKLLQFNTVKQTFAWRDLEPAQDAWDFSQADRILGETEKRGLAMIARLGQAPEWAAGQAVTYQSEKHDAPPQNLADWGDYCGTVAARYVGRIAAYQLWNEPNLSREWGGNEPDAAAYTELLRVCSAAIRAADPAAILISAGLSPTGTHDATAHRDDIYLDAMYRAGFQQYVDVVGVHAPGFSAPEYGPDDAERDGRGRWATFRRIEDLRKIMVQHGDGARQMAILEFGYTRDTVNPDYAWFAVDEATQEKYILGAYDYAVTHWRPWVGLMNLIYMPQPGWTENYEEYWWQISTFERHLMAFMGIVAMPKVCDDYVVPPLLPGPEEEYLGKLSSCP